MNLVGLAIHIGLLALTIAILVPAGITILAMVIYETIRDPEKPLTKTPKEDNSVQ